MADRDIEQAADLAPAGWSDATQPDRERQVPDPNPDNDKWPDDHMLEAAWGIIANANEGNWGEATLEWRAAAIRWRDAYHAALGVTDSVPHSAASVASWPSPAGRGDATQPDPATIERAIEAATEAYHDAYGDVALCSEEFVAIAAAVRAAAAVIVADTAEQIAAAIKAARKPFSESTYDWDRMFNYGIDEAARIARSLAAGLSAGAAITEGDSE